MGCADADPTRAVVAPREARFVRVLPRYYPGLDERVLVTKSELDVTVTRSDGRVQPLQAVEREDAAAWRAQHGRATPPLVQRLAGARPDEIVRFAATFDSLAGREDLLLRLADGDDEVAAKARDEHAALIAEQGAGVIEKLQAEGVAILGTATHAPFVFAEGTPDRVSTAASLDEVSSLLDDPEGVEAIEHAAPLSPARAHTVTGLPGVSGANWKMGVIDPGKCRINNTHALLDNPTTYQNNANGLCFTTGFCGAVCPTPEPAIPTTCASGKCRDGHGTAVTSVITQMMPDANIFYGNGMAGSSSNVCSLQETAATFDFFVANNVRNVTESYSCGVGNTTDGALQDYHARVNGVFVSRSAGNAAASGPASDIYEACAATRNSVCAGATTRQKNKRSCYSQLPGRLRADLALRLPRLL